MADIILKDVKYPEDDDSLDVQIRSNHKAKCYSWSSKWIDAIPVDEAAPVRRGRWEKHDDGIMVWWQCSECNHDAWYDRDDLYNYCPNCGAKNEEVGD